MNGRRLTAFLAIVLCCALSVGCTTFLRQAARSAAAIELAQACERQAQTGEFKSALKNCNDSISLEPAYATAYTFRALVYTALGKWSQALADSNTAVRLQPQSADGYNSRCWIKVRMNLISGAQQDCSVALALSSNEPNIRDTRADILFRLRDYQGVIADEDAMVAKYPDAPYGYGNRCAAETALREFVKAWNDCEKAISLDETGGQWYVNRGDIQRAQGRLQGALADYKHAAQIDSSAFDALREEAATYLALGNSKAALRLAKAFVGKNPFDPVGRDVLGRALAATGAKGSAASEFSIAMRGYGARHDNASIRAVQSQLAMLESSKTSRTN